MHRLPDLPGDSNLYCIPDLRWADMRRANLRGYTDVRLRSHVRGSCYLSNHGYVFVAADVSGISNVLWDCNLRRWDYLSGKTHFAGLCDVRRNHHVSRDVNLRHESDVRWCADMFRCPDV